MLKKTMLILNESQHIYLNFHNSKIREKALEEARWAYIKYRILSAACDGTSGVVFFLSKESKTHTVTPLILEQLELLGYSVEISSKKPDEVTVRWTHPTLWPDPGEVE